LGGGKPPAASTVSTVFPCVALDKDIQVASVVKGKFPKGHAGMA
jgi:hypothetical protein